MTNREAQAVVKRLAGSWVVVGSADHRLLCTAALLLNIDLKASRRVRVEMRDNVSTELAPGSFSAGAFD